MAFKKSTAWLRESKLFGNQYDSIWRTLGFIITLLGLALTLLYSFD